MTSAKEKKVFAQKQPPLSVAIRRILARYPDGQILKELLQNAEDAGASELRLILDLRQFGVEKLYNKGLSVCQGPALLAFNDAVFTEGDWENIQKTEHSHKQLDPKKIGRFGIGFNSIYHLTDFPWIMSRKMIGVFDPCERGIFRHPINGHPVGGYQWDLTDDDDREQIREMKDQFAPFKYDNFDPEIDTHFSGTLFRFPLRQQFVQPKDPDMMLSKVTYTPQRIQELFKAFEADGDRLLLFLTSICKVSLWQRSDNDEVELYSVNKEIQFTSTIPKPLEDIGNFCFYEANITVMRNSSSLSLVNHIWSFTEGTKSEMSKRWAIVQYISKDPDITNFVSDSELNLLPWVGVASPLDVESIKADGYISCFLPLPPDNESRTGLPIQVHGYFCLSDSRRSVLWPSAAAQNDPRPKWNEILANQLIPYAYLHLLEKIKKRNSDPDSHALISSLWPDKKCTKSDWNDFVVTFYKQAAKEKLFWSSVTNKWVTVWEAIFLDPTLGESDRNAIQEICSAAKKSVVCIRAIIPNHFQNIVQVSVTHVSQEYVCGLFKLDPHLLRSHHSVKKQLLNYVLTDHNCSAYLKDVPLLPLANGSFVSFNPNADKIYVSSKKHPRSLVPGLDSMFLSDEYCSDMSSVIESGLTQLCRLEPKYVPKLLPISIKNGYWNAEKDLPELWKYINRYYSANMDLTEWQGLSLIPVLSENQNFATCCIDSSAPVLSSHGIDGNVCKWLKKEFGLKLVQSMPYLEHWLGSQYILHPKMPGSALKVICQVWKKRPNAVVSAVQKVHSESNPSFTWFHDQILMSCTQSFDPDDHDDLHKFLIDLPLFCPVKGTAKGNILISANEASCYCFKEFKFEIKRLLGQIGFPFPLVSFDSNSTLISKLNLKEMSITEFVSIILNNIADGGYYSSNKKTIEVAVSWVVTYYAELKSYVTFDKLSSHLVLNQFKKEVRIANLLTNKQQKYANFCALLLNASEVIWTEICQLELIPCINNHLHCPAELVMSCGFKSMCPYICEPAHWVKGKCYQFLSCCKVRKTLSLDDMVNIVRCIHKEHADAKKSLDEKTTLKGFLEVMEEIAKLSKKFDQVHIYNLKLPLPDSVGHLRPVDDKLLYNDLSASNHSGQDMVHKAVPRHIAIHFGAKTLRDELLDQYEDNDEGEEFGQEVDLVERIRGLLKQYHTQYDLFQEFLQNADDAGATRISFFLDKRHHPTKGLLSEKPAAAELQQNAILIYNDATFSDEDIKGIQQLGVGSKANDAEKIGRFGAGFNCAYHYTDCPSFISDDKVLCVFDPLQQFLNISKKRGRKFNFSHEDGQTDFRRQFAAVYNTYGGINGFPLRCGTMFRLPLRQTKRKLSFSKMYNVSEMYKLFQDVAGNMKKMMLFLRNVSDVSAYELDDQGQLRQMWRFQSETGMSTWMTKEEFGLKVHESAKCLPSQIPVRRSSYELILKQANKEEHEVEKWLVCQRLGFTQLPSADFSKAKLLPVAGVASRLDSDSRKPHKHSLFCSLPLPHTTEMPVSINGHFSLDGEGRKNLFTTIEEEKSDVRQQWNAKLLNDIAANAYLDLLEVLKLNTSNESEILNDDSNNPIEKIENFWKFLPDIQLVFDEASSAWSGRKAFSNNLFKVFAQSDKCLFPCLGKCNGKTSIHWLNLSGNQDGPLFPTGNVCDAFLLLHELGIKIVPCPQFILKAFTDASVCILTARSTTVASYLKEPWITVTNGNQKLPCPLTDTVFQSEERVLSVLQFLLESVKLEKQDTPKFNLNGLPLLVTCDKFLRYYSTSTPAKLEPTDEVINLFSEHAGEFVGKKFRATLFGYLENHTDATVTELHLQDLYKMLPGEMRHQGINPVKDVPFCDYPINNLFKTWLLYLWCLIARLTTDQAKIEEFAVKFKDFYLIPAKVKIDGPVVLFRVDTRLQIVHPDMWKQISDLALNGLPIAVSHGHFPPISSHPQFETTFFGQQKHHEKLIHCLDHWSKLGCLKWPLEVLSHRKIGYDLLTYFDKFCQKSPSIGKLRDLPIFETFNGQIVKIMDKKVFTLNLNGKEKLPTEGQDIWMCQALFLKKHDNLMSLYEYLEVGDIDLPQLYAQFIIPSFLDMTTTDQVIHLHYLYYRYNFKNFKCAINVLKETKFVQANSGMKQSVNQFYDHTVPLFKEMCFEDAFLPHDFIEALEKVDHSWMMEFLHVLGLKHIPEPEELVKFAGQLSKLSLATHLKKIQNGSKLLLNSVTKLSRDAPKDKASRWNKCIKQMSEIEFIPSMKFDEKLQSLFPSATLDSVQLMKANGSCASNCHSLVWTATKVLPVWVPSELYEKMGILTIANKSCFKYCMEHFEKLLNYLFLAKLQQQQDVGVNSPESRKTLEVVLYDFYQFLNNLQGKRNLKENDKSKLKELPLILVEDGRHLTYPEMTVERLPVADLKETAYYAPFLYELPPALHTYKSLFESLGLQQKPCIWHYAEYLLKVYIHFHVSSENEPNWDPNIYQSVMFVQHAMVMSADESVNWDDIHTLYLLSSDGKLYKSCELVFQDSSVTKQKHLTKNTKSLKFWECSQNPGPNLLQKMAAFVKLLPDRLKLKLTSKVLSRCVGDKSENCQSRPCHAVNRLKTLFSSMEFLKCIQRLHYKKSNVVNLPNNRKWEEIGEELRNIQIHCYSKLIIELKDVEQLETLAGSDSTFKCFLDGQNLLISHEDASRINGPFSYLLADRLQELLTVELSETKLSALLACSDPNELESILDQLHVQELPGNFINSHLPVVGNSVPAECIDFLEMHPFNYFRNGEYVVFLKDNVEAETDPLHNCIWAKIVCCIDEDSAFSALQRHYKIDVGDSSGPIVVIASDLYKFITHIKSLEPGALVATDIEPEPQSTSQSKEPKRYDTDLTKEEACKEVTQFLEEARNLPPNEYQKVKRRLYLTWHPDKNTEDKKALATVVFQHLQNEIVRLEKGGSPGLEKEGESASQTFTGGQSFHEWDFFRSNKNTRWNDYSHGRSQRTYFHEFNFGSHTPHECPNPRMADKYWKMANDDLKAAFGARRCQDVEIGEDIGNEHVILLAQHTVENVLKAALFAEIGTAENHDNLLHLAKRAANRTRCSKDTFHKVLKFVSECGADISRLRYPDVHTPRPHITYTKDQAVKAVDYAREIVEDLGKAYPAFKL